MLSQKHKASIFSHTVPISYHLPWLLNFYYCTNEPTFWKHSALRQPQFFFFSKVSDSHSISSTLCLFCSPLAPFPFLHCQSCIPLLHLTIVFQFYLQILRVFLWLSPPFLYTFLWLSPPWTINVQAYVASGLETRADTIKESVSSISPKGGSYWSSRVLLSKKCTKTGPRRVQAKCINLLGRLSIWLLVERRLLSSLGTNPYVSICGCLLTSH